jgi:hypothetical protein
MVDEIYIGIITILDYEIAVHKCLAEMLFPPKRNSKRKVIVDLALKSGINQYRFVVFDVNNEGKILLNSSAYLKPSRDVVKLANAFLKERKEIVSHSMLPNAKKKELLNVYGS